MKRFLTALAALSMIAGPPSAGSLAAQTQAKPPARRASPPKAEPAPAAPAPESPPLPYDGDLLRLAEVMGSLAYLRDLCGFKDGALWRARMNDLIEAEATTPERRDRFAGAFNRGFTGFSIMHRACTPASRLAMERLLDEGGQLTRTITNRYGS